ncbi:MAG TPA: bifunctional homocysteine S-methyltransferase/methylenetetrahydrofolate reductase, partial [Vicinamibacterales bacterium]|nr:bifunctional homocysteine S-methyltransferase/methylenetetrahydrofolate reductase [Vicinamibacterales bacterium]
DERVLVCDGAMGTMLYAKGVFINRCFDSLNVMSADTVAEIHQDYVRAGADVLETNTFGANRIKLRSFGLGDRVREINFEGARIARRAARDQAYVAGAIGPLGVRIEPWGKMGTDEAEAYFREQAAALAEGGVDLFILETFRDLNEMGAAIAAVRSVSPLPIVAQMTIEDDGNSLDGTPPEQFAPEMERRGADVIGVNCSIGPAHMLETVERIAAVTHARLSAQPNAGRPRDIEGRNIYLSSPEYLASYARRFALQGVRLVGGCCGTTPEHIRQMKTAIKQVNVGTVAARSGGSERTRPASEPAGSDRTRPTPADSDRVGRVLLDPPNQPTIPRAEKSQMAAALAAGRFTTVVELLPPKGFVGDDIIELARALKIRGVDVINIPDGPRGPRMSALALAVLVQQKAGIETVLQFSCRDRNLLGMQSDLLGAHAMGIRNLVSVTGNARMVGDYPDATAVFDVDSVGLTNVITRLNHGLDIGGQGIGAPTAFHLGVMVNPGAENLDSEVRRFEYKVEAGAEFAITRPVFDAATFERLHARIASAGIPILAGLRPFESVIDAEFMANEVPGVRVPDQVLERMRAAKDAEAAAQGIAIARDTLVAIRGMVQGVHIGAAGGRIEAALAVLDGIGVSN